MSGRIAAVLQAAVEDGAVPHVVGVAADHRGVTHEAASGPREAGGGESVTADNLFRIASMTKIVTAVAALGQRERGELDFDAPVDAYCPDFAAVAVLDGFDTDGAPRLRAPASRATVAQLLTHTVGLPYGFWEPDIVRWEAAGGPAVAPGGLKDAFASPMVADPGTVFAYGVSYDWLGKVLEAAGGQALDALLADHIFGPLEMQATTFRPTHEQRSRCVPVHVRDDAGGWVVTGIDWDSEPEWWSGGHGLYSTPRDFLRFQQMLLGGGSLGDVRILDLAAVEETFTGQLRNIRVPAVMSTTDPEWSSDFVLGPGNTWGWGLLLSTNDRPGRRAAGSGSWTGVFNTNFWVDRRSGVTGALYTQALPFSAPAVVGVYDDFEVAVYEAAC